MCCKLLCILELLYYLVSSDFKFIHCLGDVVAVLEIYYVKVVIASEVVAHGELPLKRPWVINHVDLDGIIIFNQE